MNSLFSSQITDAFWELRHIWRESKTNHLLVNYRRSQPKTHCSKVKDKNLSLITHNITLAGSGSWGKMSRRGGREVEKFTFLHLMTSCVRSSVKRHRHCKEKKEGNKGGEECHRKGALKCKYRDVKKPKQKPVETRSEKYMWGYPLPFLYFAVALSGQQLRFCWGGTLIVNGLSGLAGLMGTTPLTSGIREGGKWRNIFWYPRLGFISVTFEWNVLFEQNLYWQS